MKESETFFRQDDFIVAYEVQKGWGFPIALDFFFSGTGAALFLFSLVFNAPLGLLLGLVFLIVGVLTLFLDLGSPWRAWKAFKKMRTSWISRGTLFITITVVFGVLYALAGFPEIAWFWVFLFGAIAVMVTVYPGMVLSYSPSMAAWNNPLVPILMGLHSLASGLAIFLLIYALSDGDWEEMASFQFLLLLLLLVGMIVFLLVSKASNAGARQSVHLLMKGRPKFLYLFLGLFVGVVLPLLVSLFSPGAGWGWIFIICVLRLIGDLGFRHSLLKVAVYEPQI